MWQCISFRTGGNNIVEVFKSLTKSFWTMDTPSFSRHLGTFDALFNVILTIPSRDTKWLPIMMYIHPPDTSKKKLNVFHNFFDMMTMFILYLINTISCILIVLTNWNNSRHIATLLTHYPDSESTSLSFTPWCLAEKQQIPIL